MKTKIIIKEITHDEIVNLLSTAIYGSHFLGLDYDSNEYRKLPNPEEYDCIEDRCAKLLLNGKSITVYDMYAEDEEDFHWKLPHSWDCDNLTMDYTVTLKDIISGLQRSLDGTFKTNDGCDNEIECARRCMMEFMTEYSTMFDQLTAEILMQIIVFNQIIYG